MTITTISLSQGMKAIDEVVASIQGIILTDQDCEETIALEIAGTVRLVDIREREELFQYFVQRNGYRPWTPSLMSPTPSELQSATTTAQEYINNDYLYAEAVRRREEE